MIRALAVLLAAAALAWPAAAGAASGQHRRTRGRAGASDVAPTVVARSAAAPRSPAAAGGGRVQFVTDKRAYLDRGGSDGLAPGQSLALTRAGRAVGSCTLDSISRHSATCVGGRPRPGDTFRLSRARGNRPESQARVPVLAAVTDAEILAGRASQIADGPIEKVDFTGKRAFRGHTTADVRPGFGVWFTPADPRSSGYSEERLDGAIHGVPIWATGFQFDGAFTAVRWSGPPGLQRFGDPKGAQFYLWEAEVAHRLRDGGTVAAVGRLWPLHAPGLTVLDGVQLGRQSRDRSAEGGVYGGLVPTAATVAPSAETWTAGLYGALAQVADRRATVRLAREEARVGVWRGTVSGVVTEAEGLAETWVGPVVVGAGGRGRLAARDGGRPTLEHAHVDLTLRPSLDVSAGLHLRYVGSQLLAEAPLRAEVPAAGGAVHAVVDGKWDLSPRLGVAARAAAHRDAETGHQQLQGGAELRLPRLLRGAGGVWLGGDVQQGWIQGEAVYLQLLAHHDEAIRIVARVSFDGTRFDTASETWNLHELGGYLDIEGAVRPWLRLRVWSLLRAALLVQGEPPTYPTFGGSAGLSLAGSM
jgi:hypothetical protein